MAKRSSTLAFRFDTAGFPLGVLPLDEAAFSSVLGRMPFPRVSGKAMAKKAVSAVRSIKVRIAGTAKRFSSPINVLAVRDDGIGLDAKYAPMGGPIQKQIANAIPT